MTTPPRYAFLVRLALPAFLVLATAVGLAPGHAVMVAATDPLTTTIGAEKQTTVGDRDIFGGDRDWFPLGPLGAYCLPVDGTGLRLTQVEYRGPAHNAGLREDDILTQAGETSLADADPWRAFAQAILAAQANEDDASLPLTYQRGEDNPATTSVDLPELPVFSDDRTEDCARSQAMAHRALEWLRGRQDDDDGFFPTRLAATNGQVVVTSLAGLAFLAEGSNARNGDYRNQIRDALTWVRRHCGEDPIDRLMRRNRQPANWNQTNWAWGYSGWFMAEAQHAREDRTVLRQLRESADTLCETQEEGGGWAHGPGGTNANGYTHFFFISGVVGTTLGLAERLEVDVDDDVHTAALDYLRRCIRPDGGVTYGLPWDPRGDPGRTGQLLLALKQMGEGESGSAERARTFLRENLSQLDRAHQGYLQHLLAIGLAVADDDDLWLQFRTQILPELVLSQMPDGRFVPRPTPETLRNTANNDIALGESWATAVYAILLQLHHAEALPMLTSAATPDE